MTIDTRRLYRFTATQYERMVESGVLTAQDHVELLDGEIVEMTPIGPPHDSVVSALTAWLARGLPPGLYARVQASLVLGTDTIPQPDVAVVRGVPRDYRRRHAGAADVVLVIEVADTSLVYDRRKLPLYARAGVPEVWIADIAGQAIEVYREPAGTGESGYRRSHRAVGDEPRVATGGLSISAAELLGD
jgi:Uma2 family endonuclease